MKINFSIEHNLPFEQTMYIAGSLPELGKGDENKAIPMQKDGFGKWALNIETKNSGTFSYYYLIKNGQNIVAKEWGKPQNMELSSGKTFYILDFWKNEPEHSLYSSAFADGFFGTFTSNITYNVSDNKKSMLLKVRCPYVQKGQQVVMLGESDLLGNWRPEKVLPLQQTSYANWQIVLNADNIKQSLQYKFAIYDSKNKTIVHWEEGENKILFPLSTEKKEANIADVVTFDYKHSCLHWKTSGVAIPVFSLRTEKSVGIGEFSDIKTMVDWANVTGMKIIQILPINDTTITHTWTDSYPYNAISIYALHPIYLGIREFPLKDKALFKKYLEQGKKLNELKEVDYEQTLHLKLNYLKDLYNQQGKTTLASATFKDFEKKSEAWLFSYACFCYFRDFYKTPNYNYWKENRVYNKKKLEQQIAQNEGMKEYINLCYFTQYLLHIQLLSVKEYANKKEVVLKGDIPIGISHDSVEAWVEPQLFNLDTQTGAPPDHFSICGQNWGFPTYNWDEMSKDGYQWWVKRFRKMADYFDAYRIDHILGFFRIWEIPVHAVHGLLGHFSPALPFSVEEIKNWGLHFDEAKMTEPYIRHHFLHHLFGEYTNEVIEKYLIETNGKNYVLKEVCNTQAKIKMLFAGKDDKKSNHLRTGLYSLCDQVLFLRDKHEHPSLWWEKYGIDNYVYYIAEFE